MSPDRKRVAILISGRGSNMSALIAASNEPGFPAQIVGVISDRPDAAGLALAEAVGISAIVVERKDFSSKEAHDQAIDATLHGLGAQIVCLAGYMRLLTPVFVAEWQGRMINIHPSLLPLFRGLDSHRRALDAGVRIHGCSVHFVSPEMDEGPIIAQTAIPVLSGDDEQSLSARVLKAEHRLYPQALRMVCLGEARMENGRAIIDSATNASEKASLVSVERSGTDVDVQALARFTP